MVSIYVGVTDGDWFRFLAQRPDIREVNFWQPVDTRRFAALTPGEMFKLKAPDHFIAGGGCLSVPTPIRPRSRGRHSVDPAMSTIRTRGHQINLEYW